MSNDTKNKERSRLICPQCGGNLQWKEDGERQFLNCPYCDYSELLEKELTTEEKLILEHQLTYERERGRLRAKDEYESKMRRKMAFRKHLPKLIVASVILTLLGLGVLFTVCNPLQKTIDPFDYVEVVFSGTDGRGQAVIKPLPIDGESNDIYYSLSVRDQLSEGQTLFLEASEGSYNLTKNKKTYFVTGLDLYVTDASQLDEAAQNYLHELSENAIDQGYGRGVNYSMLGVFTKKYDTYTCRLRCIVLLSNGQRRNCILNVYEATFTNESNAETVYIVYELTGVVLHKNSATPLSFENGYFAGDCIDIGNAYGKGYLGSLYGFRTEEDLDIYIRKGAANHNYTVIQKIPAEE